jgi:hypothetical protein
MLLLSNAALAQEAVTSKAPPRLPSLEVSLKAGGHFPQLLNRLGTSFDGILKVGYMPFEGRQLQFFAEVGYSAPTQTLSATDSRLGDSGETYNSTLTLHDFATTSGIAYYFRSPSESLLPYAGAGLRIHFLKAQVVGASSSDFGQTSETEMKVGGMVMGGVAYRLGPGLLLGELAIGYAPVSQKVTGEANIGAASLLLGYGLMF